MLLGGGCQNVRTCPSQVEITVPERMLRGERDPMVPAAATQRRAPGESFPNAELGVWVGAGHASQTTGALAVLTEVL